MQILSKLLLHSYIPGRGIKEELYATTIINFKQFELANTTLKGIDGYGCNSCFYKLNYKVI